MKYGINSAEISSSSDDGIVVVGGNGDDGTQNDEGEIRNLVNEGEPQLQADAAAAVVEGNEGAAVFVDNEAAAAAAHPQNQEEQLAAAVLWGKLEVIDGEDGENNFPPPIPVEQQFEVTNTKRGGKLEVIHDGVGDDNISPPIPIELQLEITNTKRSGKLEVIDDGVGDDNISPPIPIEQLQLTMKNTKKEEGDGKATNCGTSQEDRQRIMETPHSLSAGRVDDTAEGRTNSSALPPSATWTRSPIPPLLSSFRQMTDDDIEQQPEEEIDAAPFSDYLPLPLLEATLVDDIIYDAFAVRPSWWKRHPKVAVCGLLLVSAAIVAGVAIAIRDRTRAKQKAGNQPSPTPPSYKCVANRGELISAIDRYLTTEDCPSNRNCGVGKEYGWPMNSWCVSNINDMSSLFEGRKDFNEDISSWDVSSVTTMNGMFNGAVAFNGDLSSWDVSSVTDMDGMFSYATAFNGNLSSWNVSSVTTMGDIFWKAVTFNGDLSSWDVSSVTNM